MKNYILLFISLFFLISCKRTVAEKLGHFLEKNNPKEISLSDFTDFDWDYVWICQDMFTDKFDSIVKEKNINTDYFHGPVIWGESPDFVMIFLNKGKVVYLDSPPYMGSGIDVMPLYSFMFDKEDLARRYILYPKNKAKFRVTGGKGGIAFKGRPHFSLRLIYPSMEADSLPVYP